MDVSKNLFKSSMIYFIGQVLSKIISFLLLPLYTNYVATESFGYYDISISILGIVVPVIFMEIWTGTLRFSLEQHDEDGKRKIINNSMIIAAISMVIYTILYIVAAILFKFDLPIWLYAYSFFWVIQLFLLSVTRAYGKNGLYAASGVISVFFNAVITIAAVLLTNGSMASLFIGVIVSMIIQSLIINHKFKIFSNFTMEDYDADLIKSLVHFSLPLCFNSVLYWMLEGFNKITISSVLGLAAAGVYAAGNKISVVLNLVISVFSLSWQETIFKIEDKEQKENVYNTGFNMLIKVVGAGLVLLIPVISLMFPYVVGEKYRSVRGLIPFLLIVIMVVAITSLLSSCFAAEKDNRRNLYAKVVACIVNVSVLFSTIHMIGFYASPLALFLANTCAIAVQIFLLRKHVRITPKYLDIALFIVMFLLATCIYMTNNIVYNLLWLIIAGLFYLFYLRDFIKQMLNVILSMKKSKD